MSAALVGAAVVVGLLLVAPRDEDAGIKLTVARDAVVTFADGRTAPASPGQSLPDGAVVRTGPAGRVVADGTALAANEEAVVDGGRLRRRGSTDTTVLRPPTTFSAPTIPAGRLPRPVVTSEQPAVSSTRPVAASTTTAPTRPTTTTSSTTVPTRPAELSLRASRTDARTVALGWTRYEGADFRRYVLVRSEGRDTRAPEPVYPPGEHMVIAASITDSTATRWTDRVPDGVRDVLYRIVALDASDRVIGRSPAVRPA
jgi:hypothetical protein